MQLSMFSCLCATVYVLLSMCNGHCGNWWFCFVFLLGAKRLSLINKRNNVEYSVSLLRHFLVLGGLLNRIDRCHKERSMHLSSGLLFKAKGTVRFSLSLVSFFWTEPISMHVRHLSTLVRCNQTKRFEITLNFQTIAVAKKRSARARDRARAPWPIAACTCTCTCGIANSCTCRSTTSSFSD